MRGVRRSTMHQGGVDFVISMETISDFLSSLNHFFSRYSFPAQQTPRHVPRSPTHAKMEVCVSLAHVRAPWTIPVRIARHGSETASRTRVSTAPLVRTPETDTSVNAPRSTPALPVHSLLACVTPIPVRTVAPVAPTGTSIDVNASTDTKAPIARP